MYCICIQLYIAYCYIENLVIFTTNQSFRHASAWNLNGQLTVFQAALYSKIYRPIPFILMLWYNEDTLIFKIR